MTPGQMLFLLLIGHALADYPLQGDFLAKAKNRHTAIPGVPWWQAMAAHALIHGGAVYVVTQNFTLAAVEVLMHSTIDRMKCEGVIGFNLDQALHVACKVAYVALIYWGIA